MNTNQTLDIQKLQRNLPSLRKLAGWTSEDLGEKVGVTKQTISNLETGRTTMTKIQYIAIRAVLDYQGQTNENLAKALHLVLDNNNESEETQHENEDKVKTVAAATAAGVSNFALGALLGAASIAFGAWLATLVDDN